MPSTVRLALEDVAPNPVTGPIGARFSLPAARAARLDVFDVDGRRIHSRQVGMFGAGNHTLMLNETAALRPGVYVLRLSQDGLLVSKRFVKIR